ncbi:hypothetical protein KY289_007352 [Solanum tuberosum]|nr:hypothetical protein KY289_007352 [Solanum tuberosum]
MLPKNAEATIDLGYEQVKYLKLAQDGLKEPIAKFLEESTPDFIIFDFASYWIPSIASKFNIPTRYFSIFIAAVLGFTGPVRGLNNDYEIRKTPEEYTVPPKWVPFETTVAFKLFEVLRIFEATIKGEEENVSDAFRMHRTLELSDFLLAKPSQNEVTELALGLELSGLPVFWVLRTKRREYDDELIKLPEGYEDRIKGRGIVCMSWAPQLKILSHDSVGGILTHSRWSSVVETIQFEKPLVLLTFLADQGLNARLLEEKEDGVFDTMR